MTGDFLDEKRAEIAARLTELKPFVDEYTRLEAAVVALDGVASLPAAPRHALRRPAARARTTGTPTSSATARGGRPAGSGKRRAEALAVVAATPGITIPQIAEKMGIKHNYLYRVLPRLAAEGLVIKHGRGWHPAAS